MAEFYHQAAPCSGKEVVATEIPGELWVKMFDAESAAPQYVVQGEAKSPAQAEPAPVISVRQFISALERQPQDLRCQYLKPYVQEAMDLGYEFLMLTC